MYRTTPSLVESAKYKFLTYESFIHNGFLKFEQNDFSNAFENLDGLFDLQKKAWKLILK